MNRLFFERRVGSRAHVDLPSRSHDGGARRACRTVDLSASGLLIERGRGQEHEAPPPIAAIELRLGGERPVRARARTVWSEGRLVALKFVLISDVDRLTIAELLDGLERAGQTLH
jgi:hypothetical protein